MQRAIPNDVNTPPWDTQRQPQNPIDTTHVFVKAQDIFSFGQPAAPTPPPAPKITESKPKDSQIPQDSQATKDLSGALNSQKPQDSQAMQGLPPQNNAPMPQDSQATNTQAAPLHDDSTEAIALALKYRPKTFAELVGQESVARTLCLALDSKKIANAYLFSGLRGSGKTSSARILARSLQCEVGITSSPCGVCPNCQAALKGSHMDIVELDGASNRKIDDIRDLIEQTKYKPTMGRFKVFIIDEVHMLTKEAFNSLLKTLEEPPSYVKFILATTDPLKVPPTILSRTQHFRFKKIPTNALKNHLAHILQKEQVQADNESLDMIIRNGHGSLRDTLTLLDQAIVFCQNELTTTKLADMLGSLDPKAFDTLFQALLRKNMQECVQFARSLEGYEIETILDELSLYIKNKMLEEIPQIPPILGMRYANIINDSRAMLQLDCDSEFCLLLTVLKMLEAQKIREVANAIKQLESMQIHTQAAQITPPNVAQTPMQSANVSSNMPPDSKSMNFDKSLDRNLDVNLHANPPTNPLAPDSQTLNDVEAMRQNRAEEIDSHANESNKGDFNAINQGTIDSKEQGLRANPASQDLLRQDSSTLTQEQTQIMPTQSPQEQQTSISQNAIHTQAGLAAQEVAHIPPTQEERTPQTREDMNLNVIPSMKQSMNQDTNPSAQDSENLHPNNSDTQEVAPQDSPSSLPQSPNNAEATSNSYGVSPKDSQIQADVQQDSQDSRYFQNVPQDLEQSQKNLDSQPYIQNMQSMQNTQSAPEMPIPQQINPQDSQQSQMQQDSHNAHDSQIPQDFRAAQPAPTLSELLTKKDSRFLTLIQKLYERDYTIGSLFENKIGFEGLSQNILHLTFYMTPEETDILRQGYSGIMQVMRQIYGDSIKMEVQKKTPQDLLSLQNSHNQNAPSYMPHNESQMTTAQDNVAQTPMQSANMSSDSKSMSFNGNLDANIHATNLHAPDSQGMSEEKREISEAQQPPRVAPTQATSPQDSAMQFIAQNGDMLKSMKNELGIKDMKIISLDIIGQS